jgi:hypothetical protein
MLTGETLDDVRAFLGHDGSHQVEWSDHPEKRAGFGYSEILRYLADRGFSLGCFVVFADGKKLQDLEFEKCPTGHDALSVPVPFSPGLFVVKSERIPGEKHIVVWDGEKVRDPSPASAPERGLDGYLLHEFWPLVDIRDNAWKRWKGEPPCPAT